MSTQKKSYCLQWSKPTTFSATWLFVLLLLYQLPSITNATSTSQTHHTIHKSIEDHFQQEMADFLTYSSEAINNVNILPDDGNHGSWFAKPLTEELMRQRNREQYPFVSVDYYISKANTFIDRMGMPDIDKVLRYQHDVYGQKPIIFVPSEYIFHYAQNLSALNISFSLITVSNQPICVPYMSYPPICNETEAFNSTCALVENLLSSSYLDKWFTKNPCIEHPKIHPLPVGPKWQWGSRLFFDEDGIVGSTNRVFRQHGLKPYALLNNYTHLLQDMSYTMDEAQQDEFAGADELLADIQKSLIDKALIPNWKKFSGFIQMQRQHNAQSWFLQIEKIAFPGKDRLLYFNFFANTTDRPLYRPHANTRRQAYESLIANGFQPSPRRQISGYLQDLSEHKFCISPPGVGLDAHRTWEALMVGTIPIVLSSPLNKLLEGLPVVIVDSYDAVTPAALQELYHQSIAQIPNYDFRRLFVHYWDEIIQ